MPWPGEKKSPRAKETKGEIKKSTPNSPPETPCTVRAEKKKKKEKNTVERKWRSEIENWQKQIPPLPAGCSAR
jgi:hypothetical protein